MWLCSVLGSIGLVFRYWVTNIKIRDLLQHRIGHLSRFLSYIFFIAMILNFENNIFTLMVIGAFPTMIVAFLSFDLNFYNSIFRKDWAKRLEINETGNFKEKHKTQKMRLWIFLERITMHIPLIILGTYFYIEVGVKEFFMPNLHFITILIAFIFILGSFFVLDPRWIKFEDDGKRNEWPAGLYILIGALLESVFLVLYLFIDFSYLWN